MSYFDCQVAVPAQPVQQNEVYASLRLGGVLFSFSICSQHKPMMNVRALPLGWLPNLEYFSVVSIVSVPGLFIGSPQ
jgi:hypothetical protein